MRKSTFRTRALFALFLVFIASHNLFAETEPNNDVASANLIKVNETMTGSLSSSDEFDFYKIVITENGRLSIMDNTSSNLDYHVNLFDGDGSTLIKSVLRYNNNTGHRIAVNLSQGTYYIQTDRWGSSSDGDYTIFPQFEPVTYPGDAEVNDSFEDAATLELNKINTGNLGSRRDRDYDEFDWWKITLPEGGLLTLTDSTEPNLDYYMNLYKQDGTTLIRSVLRYKNNSGPRISEKLSAGTYYLLMDKWSGDYSTYGTYVINSGFLPKPVAGFAVSQDIRSFSFTNKTVDGEIFFWDFNDGETSDLVNPSHSYSTPGEYLISLIAENEAGADTATQMVVIYGVSDILPKEAGNSGEVTFTILGGGFSEDASISLSMEGNEDLVASRVEYFERGAVRATFNMSGVALGKWDITVNNPGNTPIVKEEAVSIVQATEPEPWVNLSGRSRALFNRWQTYTLEYGNTGNVDADIVPVWITH